MMGQTLEGVDTLFSRHITSKLNDILIDETHPLRDEYDSRRIARSGRYRLPRVRTSRYANSFIPLSISSFNKQFKRDG